jgi:uncharacterized protein (DUF3084 family)
MTPSNNNPLNSFNETKKDSAQLQLAAYREELDAVQEELEQLRYERDIAIDMAGELTIESGKCKAEVSESHDRVEECKSYY